MNFKPMIHKLGLAGLTFGEKWFQVKSVEKAERRGAKMAGLLYRFDKKHRTRTHANIELASPEISLAERQSLAKKMYDHFGYIFADFMRIPLRSQEEFAASMTVEGIEHLEAARAVGKGVILLSAHLGNWERFGQWFKLNNIEISGVARDANDEEITSLVTKIRGDSGIKVLSRGNAARDILTRLKAGEGIVIMPDQNDDEAFIPFFGHIAGTVLGPARIHLKTGSPILPLCILRTGAGTYKIVFREALVANDGEKAEELMTRCNYEIEAMVRMAPEQYLWMHDRWKNARRKGLL